MFVWYYVKGKLVTCVLLERISQLTKYFFLVVREFDLDVFAARYNTISLCSVIIYKIKRNASSVPINIVLKL